MSVRRYSDPSVAARRKRMNMRETHVNTEEEEEDQQESSSSSTVIPAEGHVKVEVKREEPPQIDDKDF
eukprot:3664319-Karenia_brevis.AAC.1